MTIGKTRPTLVLVPGVSFLVHFYPNLKNSGNLESSFDWPIFQKNLRYNNFRNFRNCDLLENKIVLRLRPTLKSSIVGFFRNRNSQLSQSILQPWLGFISIPLWFKSFKIENGKSSSICSTTSANSAIIWRRVSKLEPRFQIFMSHPDYYVMNTKFGSLRNGQFRL